MNRMMMKLSMVGNAGSVFCTTVLVALIVSAKPVHCLVAEFVPTVETAPSTPRPIDSVDTVWMEEMTWMEVRDAIKSGKTTVIVATGGIEQNGPYIALGKHNFVMRQTTEAIARRLGNALVAPIVKYTPEGDIDPPSHHMRYPGTIGISETTFRILLTDIARALRTQGFRHIVFIGDSGDTQPGMKEVAEMLSGEWAGSSTAIDYIAAFYDHSGMREFLEERGVHEESDGFHHNFRYTAQIMTLDPELVRLAQRLEIGHDEVNGVTLKPVERTLGLGWQLIEFQAERTAKAIKAAVEGHGN